LKASDARQNAEIAHRLEDIAGRLQVQGEIRFVSRHIGGRLISR